MIISDNNMYQYRNLIPEREKRQKKEDEDDERENVERTGAGGDSLWVRKETTVEIMNNAHLIRFVRSSLVAHEKLGSGFPNQSSPLTLIVNSAGTGLSPALRCGQSSKLKKAVFRTSDAFESEERKQKQGCAFVAHPFFSRPRETLPSEVVL